MNKKLVIAGAAIAVVGILILLMRGGDPPKVSGLPWYAIVKQHSWQQAGTGKQGLKLMFDNHRYFVIKGLNRLVDQGKLVTKHNKMRFYLYNQYGSGYIRFSKLTKKSFRAEIELRGRYGKTRIKGEFKVSTVPLTPPVAKHIHVAAKYGDLVAVRHFINNGVSVDGDEGARRTPLGVAAAYHHSRVVQFLLKKGADPNRTGQNREPPLLLAIKSGDTESAEALIKAGAKVNYRDAEGISLLFHALERDSFAMVKLLLANGANTADTDNYGYTSIHRAMAVFSLRESRIIERLEYTRHFVEKSGFDPKTVDRHGRNLLFYAANLGLSKTVTYLVAKGVSPWHKDNDGKNVFEYIKESEYRSLILPILGKVKNPAESKSVAVKPVPASKKSEKPEKKNPDKKKPANLSSK